MKRFRLSTLLLLIVITAMGFALVTQQMRISRLESDRRRQVALQAGYLKLNAALRSLITALSNENELMRNKEASWDSEQRNRAATEAEGVAGDGK